MQRLKNLSLPRSALAILLALTPLAVPARAASASSEERRPKGDLKSYCGVPFPEDIEPIPGTRSVIAIDMHLKAGPAGVEPQPGVLKLVDLGSGAVTPLYPAPRMTAGRPAWGDPACRSEIGGDLLPHGIHLSRRRDRKWQLLVVNHGGWESVEFFELLPGKGRWSARWLGCVVAPASSHLNQASRVFRRLLYVRRSYGYEQDPE
jgi:hypothetical protein